MSDVESTTLLDSAWAAGFRRFDTAPSYGFGRSEVAVGELIRRRAAGDAGDVVITTKVGIAPVGPPSAAVRAAKAAARRLPASLQNRLRGNERPTAQGRFDPDQVAATVETALARLGRIDRLQLHEVQPADITPALCDRLAGYVARGDVGLVGVATSNELTAQCLAVAPELLRAAHVAIGLFAPDPGLPDGLAVRVGHGLLGAGGRDVATVRDRLAADPELGRRWQDAVAACGWIPADAAIARALFARAVSTGATDVIVATSRPAILPTLLDVGAAGPLPLDVAAVLDEIRR